MLFWSGLISKVKLGNGAREYQLKSTFFLGSLNSGGLEQALKNMQGSGTSYEPFENDQSYHQKKFQVFLKMLEDQKEYRAIMN